MSTRLKLGALATTFALISIVAIGGIAAVMPEVYRQVVDVRGWMTASELADLYALGQAAPGPNGMVVGLVGWRVAGGRFVLWLLGHACV